MSAPAGFVQYQGATDTGTSHALNLASAPTEGNTIIACCRAATTIANVTPPAGFTSPVNDDDSDGLFSAGIWIKVAGASESAHIAFTTSVSVQVVLDIFEFKGLYRVSSVDKTNVNDTVGIVNSSTTGSTGTLSQANELVFAYCAHGNTSVGHIVDSGMTLVQTDTRTAIGYKVVAATTALNPNFQWTTARATTAMIITFKANTVVAAQLDARWSVRSPVAAQLDARWAVRGLVSVMSDMRYAVRGTVSKQLDLRYAVRALASKQLDVRYAVRSLANKVLDIRYAVRGLAGNQLDLRYAVRGLATKQLDIRWSVRNAVAVLLNAQWSVRQRVAKQFDLRYRVAGLASKEVVLQWSVRSLVSKQVQLLWQVRQAVSREWSLLWKVDEGGILIGPTKILVNGSWVHHGVRTTEGEQHSLKVFIDDEWKTLT